ncbi:MAG: hypothetical protein A2X94_09660 [Bdellovibrionales bacterium GWB1_55_8]|nr:MAG: hypothetical protein A2X94_09660 [Bdellovibrionales bacterium GWB1_55_8]
MASVQIRKFLTTGLMIVFSAGLPPAQAGGAKTHTLFLGAAGEPAGSTTLFDLSLRTAGAYFSTAKHPVKLVFDGGHSVTEKIAAQFYDEREDISPETAKGSLRALKKDIERGKIKKGEQVLVALVSHGARREGDEAATHGVSIGRQQLLQSRELIPLRDAAEKAGVRLAIIDQSCFSGDTLAIASDKTCVVSATGEDVVSYPVESESFWKNVNPGVSLEEAFLRGRSQRAYPSVPMISTAAGKATAELIREVSASLIGWVSDLEKQADKHCVAGCSQNFPAEDTTAKLDHAMTKIAKTAIMDSEALKKFRVALEEQYRFLHELFFLTSDLKAKDKRQEKLVDGAKVDWKYMVGFDQAELRQMLETELASGGSMKFALEEELKQLPLVEEVRARLLSENEEFRKYVEAHARYKQLFGKMWQESVRVSLLERGAYDRIYRSMKSEGANPCRDFVF